MSVDVLRVLGDRSGAAGSDVAYREPAKLTRAQAEALLEASYLAVAANGDLSDEEAEAFRALVPRVLAMAGEPDAAPPSDAGLQKLLDAFDANLSHTKVDDRLSLLANTLDQPDLRDLGYKLAFALSLCDLATDDDEADYLDALANKFGLEDRLDRLTAEVYAALDGSEDDAADT